jgi:hypothetical protein
MIVTLSVVDQVGILDILDANVSALRIIEEFCTEKRIVSGIKQNREKIQKFTFKFNYDGKVSA